MKSRIISASETHQRDVEAYDYLKYIENEGLQAHRLGESQDKNQMVLKSLSEVKGLKKEEEHKLMEKKKLTISAYEPPNLKEENNYFTAVRSSRDSRAEKIKRLQEIK